MNWSDIPRNPSLRTLRQFAALCLLIFGAMALLQALVKHHPNAATIFTILALTLGSIGLIRPQMLRWPFVIWMYAAFPIGWVVSQITLVVIFYALFTPVAIIFRLLGRDALILRRPSTDSCWLEKPTPTDKRRYFSQF